ncbi:kidins220 [Symbiodinium necroappetens]|uniref:Kidins220 protein n=1 Tax=Symbiodinium necroappetens TaxID=1628268 RepID=A0A812VPZ6_9DINO|nr:kidins220 [Symbiodinium necroappetens]
MEQELQTTSSELPDSELVMGSLQVLHDAGCLTEKSFSGKPMGKLSRCRMDAGYLKRAKMSQSLAKSGGQRAYTHSYKALARRSRQFREWASTNIVQALCSQMRFDGSSGFFQRLRFGGSTVPACSTEAAGSRGRTFVAQLLGTIQHAVAPLVGHLGSLCSTQPQLSHTALAAIRDLIKILDRASSPDDVLDFALAAYFDEAVLRHFRSLMGKALENVASGERGSTSIPPLPVLLQHCEEDFEAFSDWCGKVGDAYVYFVFLDIKGDRALLTHAAKRLQQLLRVDVRSLIANLSATRHWVQLVWKELACQRRSQTLQRMHMQALQQWLSHAKEAAVASLCDIGGRAFWDMYFCGLTKISWHDFVDGLQEQFLKDFCAQDRL